MNFIIRMPVGVIRKLLICASLFAFFPVDVYAQTVDSAMTPEKGESVGELRRGELLVTALKREKIEGNSIRLAMQSMGQLFDFRLSRAGDRYLYRVGANRRLTMLRYQRGQHVYESVLDADTNGYTSRLLDIPDAVPGIPPVIEPAQGMVPGDEDGEVDVEHAALAGQVNPDAVGQGSLDALNNMEMAGADDPVMPLDPVLADRPSPDEEYPEKPGFAPSDITVPDETGGEMPEDAFAESAHREMQLHEEDLREDYDSGAADMPVPSSALQQLPDVSTPIIEPNVPLKTIHVEERESTTFSTISLVMFIIGVGLFLLSLLLFVIPSASVRHRCRKYGLKVRDMLKVSPNMRLLRVETEGHDCIIAAYQNSMSFIAPCPPDDDALWQHIRAKSYWYEMAQNPISDRQLRAIVDAFMSPDTAGGVEKSSTPTLHDHSDVKLTEMPTAKAVPDLKDFDDDDDEV